MRRGIQLPQLTNLGALPAPDGRLGFSGWFGRQPFCRSESADGSAVQPEVKQTMHLLRGEGVGAGWFGGQPFAKEFGHTGWPVWLMISPGASWYPQIGLTLSAGPQVIGVKFVKPGFAEL